MGTGVVVSTHRAEVLLPGCGGMGTGVVVSDSPLTLPFEAVDSANQMNRKLVVFDQKPLHVGLHKFLYSIKQLDVTILLISLVICPH